MNVIFNSLFKKYSTLFVLILVAINTIAQDYRYAPNNPNANYFTIVTQERAKLEQKKQQLILVGRGEEKGNKFREEVAQFERWAFEWRDKVDANGKFPNSAAGWINALQSNPELFRNESSSAVSWTSLGPTDAGTLNGWTFGGGIGRINVVRRHSNEPGVLYAGSASGGVFKSTDLGSSWTPLTDNFAGLGVSDLVIHPTNPQTIIMATGDFDASHVNSIGIFKSTDAGATWTQKLAFTLNQNIKIAHLYVDPDFGTNSTIWATTTNDIYKSTDAGETWASAFNSNDEQYNDFIKIGNDYFVSGFWGTLFKSTTGGTSWTKVYQRGTYGSQADRIDFAYSANTPDILYIMAKANPAYAKYTISTNTMGTFSNITNSKPADTNGDYNTQGSYNQVIAVNPTNGNEVITGEFSAKRSTDAGATWTNFLNGYYDPSDGNNWGSFYVHSDHHYIEFITSDSIIVGNDGGVYIGNTTNGQAFKECFNGLTTTQSYSISIFDTEPRNVMIGNQDNDGRSRNYDGTNSTWYGASAGDGTATAIHRTNKDIRYVSGTNGKLAYRTDAYVGNYNGTSITPPAAGLFNAPIEMHLTDGDILYGGYDDVYKRTSLGGTWSNLTSGIGAKPKFIGLSKHPTDATKQRIVAIGENNVVRKTTDETSWSGITLPIGVTFNSIYWNKNSDTMYATAPAYSAVNKVFFSNNAGASWVNITGSLPNIQMKKIIQYEGSDTIFLATEIGMYFARMDINNALGGGLLTAWAKYGNGLPNVRIEDMEISYTKNQLFAGTFGRGVWMVDLRESTPLPLNNIDFTYQNTSTPNQYKFKWKIEVDDVQKTTIQKSTDGRNFENLNVYTDSKKISNDNYLVTLQNNVEYFRLKYMNQLGNEYYSPVIRLQKNQKGSVVSVYPNPTNNYIFVNSSEKIKSVIINSVAGVQVAYATPLQNFYRFDMSQLPNGTYYVTIKTDQETPITQTVIKN